MPSKLANATNGELPALSLLDKLTALEMPSQSEFIRYLAELGSLQGVILIIIGVVFLLQGWKAFKILVVANAAFLGGTAGMLLGERLGGQNMPVFGAMAGGVLLAALSWPLIRGAVSLMGALAGGLMGYCIWSYASNAVGRSDLGQHAWAGAVIGLVGLGLLAFVVFQLTVIIFTAFQGSMMIVSGLITLLLKHGGIHNNLRETLSGNVHLLPLLIAVPAVFGFALQYKALLSKARRKKKAVEGA